MWCSVYTVVVVACTAISKSMCSNSNIIYIDSLDSVCSDSLTTAKHCCQCASSIHCLSVRAATATANLA